MREFVKQQVTIFVERRRARREKLCAMITDVQEKTDRCQERLEELQKGVQVLGTDVIDRVWNIHPKAPLVFARYHLDSCDKCAVRFDETIHEAARAYGFSEEALLAEINMLLRGKQ